MNLEKKVQQTLKRIKINKKEKILLALSGGKDSGIVAFVLKKLGYNIEGLHINLCVGKYSQTCEKKVKELCNKLNIKLHVYDLKKQQGQTMKEIWRKNKNLNHCSACGVIKKYVMNKQARKLKAKKIVTGHNLDDEIQTFLLNIFKGSPELSANTGIITNNIQDKKFIPRVKPLFYIQEKDILEYAKKKKIHFLSGKCPFANISYRIEIRDFLRKLSTKEKNNIISNFENLKPKLNKIKNKNKNYCKICAEPCRGNVCKACITLK